MKTRGIRREIISSAERSAGTYLGAQNEAGHFSLSSCTYTLNMTSSCRMYGQLLKKKKKKKWNTVLIRSPNFYEEKGIEKSGSETQKGYGANK